MSIRIQGPKAKIFKSLSDACSVAEKRNTIQIIGNVHIQQDAASFVATGTDIDIQIRTCCELPEGGGDGCMTVNAMKLIGCFRNIPNEAIVSIVEENGKARVSCGNARTILQTLPADEFPLMKQEEYTARFSMTCSRFRHILEMVHYAMASQDIRYFLNGMLLETEGKVVRGVATDGHRLASCDVELECEAGHVQAIIPRKTVLEMIKVLPANDSQLTIEMCSKQMRLCFEDVELITKLIDGKYPDWRRVVPATNDKIFLIDREALFNSLQRASNLTDKFNGAGWRLESGLVRLTYTNSEQEQYTDEIPVEYEGEPLDIGFNITYLIDVLSNLKNDKVRFAMGQPQNSAMIMMPSSESFMYIVMPMRI